MRGGIRTKRAMIASVARAAGEPQAAVERTIEAWTRYALEEIAGGRPALLPGLGRIRPVARRAREGRHPATGERISVPAQRSAALRLERAAKAQINGPDGG